MRDRARSRVGAAPSSSLAHPPGTRCGGHAPAPPRRGRAAGGSARPRARAPFWFLSLGRGAENLRGGCSSLQPFFSRRRRDPGEGHGRRETEEGGFSPGSQSRKGGAALASPRRPALRMLAERGGPRRREREARGPRGLM